MSTIEDLEPWVGSLLILACLPALAGRAGAAEPAGRRVRRGQLLQAGPADLPGPLPGLPPARQGRRRLRDDQLRPAPRRRRVEGRGRRPQEARREPPVEQITPEDGKAEMPKDKPPLAAAEIELVRKWIAQGAVDDTPAGRPRPVRQGPPARLLAGRRSSRRWTSRPTARCSPSAGSTRSCSGRPTAPSWSPGWSASPSGSSRSGSRPTATGWPSPAASPAGWARSRSGTSPSGSSRSRSPSPSTPSTARAGRPTARKIAFGCADNSVRAIDAKTGEQVLFMGSHNDWVLDTAFSSDGTHLISVGRDMTAKLTEVATQRFVDNITSITPGALKGGLAVVARHPKRDEILVGGSDGDAQALPDLPPDGPRDRRRLEPDPRVRRRCRAGSSASPSAPTASGSPPAAASTARGEVDVYAYEFDTGTAPTRSRRSCRRTDRPRSPQERAELDKYPGDGVKRIAERRPPPTPDLRRRASGPTARSSPRPAPTASSG